MRAAFLCKRRYMGKDVILDRYARLYEIPFQLARLGHEVRGYCLSYTNAEEGEWTHPAKPGHLHWESRSLGRLKLPRLAGYPGHLHHRLRKFSPHIVIGASDIPHVWIASRMAQRLGVPFAADLYDNFEGFGQARIPGFVGALRKAVRAADLVTTTSAPLRRLVMNEYQARGNIISMPSTVDKKVFHPRDMATSRRALGLPEQATLFGTAGGLARSKGISILYDAWNLLKESRPDMHLVLAGPHESSFPPPDGDRVHYLGALPHARIAELFCALDLGVISIPDTPFGRYCFPQKAYEMLACDLPVLASDVGAVSDLFHDYPNLLFAPDDAETLSKAVLHQLVARERPQLPIKDWTQLVGEIEPELRKLVYASGSSA